MTKKKILALLLVAVMVLSTIPVMANAAEEGTIEEITSFGTVEGSNITVAGATLDWHAKDPSIGRYQDGWWIGAKIIAPASVTDSNVSSVNYSNDGTDTLAKSFGTNNDGKTGEGKYWMGCWVPVTPEYLETALANGKVLRWTYKFDWTGDGTVDQTYTITVDPSNITLNKDAQVYCKTVDGKFTIRAGAPADGTIEEITSFGTVEGSNITVAGATLDWHAKDPSIGRYQDGWWIGAKIIAPASVTDSNVSSVNYSNDGTDTLAKSFGTNNDGKTGEGKYWMGCWVPVTPEYLETALVNGKVLRWTYKFDWTGDGTVDQTYTITVDPSNITLNKDAQVNCQTINGVMVIKDGTSIPADYTAVDTAIAKIPADLSVYTDTTAKAVNDAKAAVVRGKRIDEQATVDAYAAAIDTAVSGLKYKDADYTAVDTAIAKIPADLSVYTDTTAKAVNDAKAAVVRGKNITEQAAVDAMAKAIEDAVAALEYKAADYTKVDAAIGKIPADLSVYTDATAKAVNDAKAAVASGKNITEQAAVDAMAKAIEDAVAALEYKAADYTKVDAAIAKIPADLSVYTDATAKAVNEAKAAVVRGKSITEQADVDAYAAAITEAVSKLEFKPEEGQRVEVSTGLKEVPAEVTVKYTTVEAIQEAMVETAMKAEDNLVEETVKTVLLDVELQMRDAGGNWVAVTPDNFPAEGVETLLPYPEGTGKNTHTFVITHMITHGPRAGEIEVLNGVPEDGGIRVKFTSMSPVVIAYQPRTASNPATGDMSQPMLWLTVLLFSGLGLGIVCVTRKKRVW